MGKRTRGKKAAATRPSRGRRHRERAGRTAPPEPNPLAEIADAVAQGDPLSLLMLASSLIASVDTPAPFTAARSSDQPTLDDLVTSFEEIDQPETRALVTAIAALVDDDAIRRRIDPGPATGPVTAVPWLAGLRSAVAADAAFEMVDVLGDADNVVVGLRVPPGHDVAVMVLVDHNLGTVVKDVIPAPLSPADFAEQARALTQDPDITVRPLDPADARARLEDAIRTGSMMFPPLESESWPAGRPLVEWILRLLPTGGSTYERPEWDDGALNALADRFFASSVGAGLDDADRRDLLESLLWFGTDSGPGDPLRWSPTAVEIVLADWIPRKIVADVAHLSRAPELLRAWIRFCHDERGIPEALTAQTLGAVDDLEPQYQHTIRSPRPQGPAALLAAMGLGGGDGDGLIGPGMLDTAMLHVLGATVGGSQALERLSTEPLPDEDLDTTGVPTDARTRVHEVVALVDRYCDELLDVEYRTACRRLVARLATQAPESLRRGRVDTTAAAVCWIVGKANRLFETTTAKELAAHVGLAPNTMSQRGKALLTGLGVDSHGYDIDLGSPELLTSSRRAQIVDDRDRFRAGAQALDGGSVYRTTARSGLETS